ncbi:MAG: hypothetical protein EP330_16720 [Deltaproteobacteria bacterium]|nr:MAG: hypothetical protein EP330_16720 [Deltaproteobacteria bacterium]
MLVFFLAALALAAEPPAGDAWLELYGAPADSPEIVEIVSDKWWKFYPISGGGYRSTRRGIALSFDAEEGLYSIEFTLKRWAGRRAYPGELPLGLEARTQADSGSVSTHRDGYAIFETFDSEGQSLTTAVTSLARSDAMHARRSASPRRPVQPPRRQFGDPTHAPRGLDLDAIADQLMSTLVEHGDVRELERKRMTVEPYESARWGAKLEPGIHHVYLIHEEGVAQAVNGEATFGLQKMSPEVHRSGEGFVIKDYGVETAALDGVPFSAVATPIGGDHALEVLWLHIRLQ